MMIISDELQQKSKAFVAEVEPPPQRINLPTGSSIGPVTKIAPRALKPNPDLKIVKNKEKPTPYPMAKTTWGEKFNPSNQVPGEGFYAFYFDRSNPTQLVHKEHVGQIGIDYSYNEFHGINSQNFAAYWVGVITTHGKETIEVKADDGWNAFRVIIDGAVVQEHKRSPAAGPVISLRTSARRAPRSPEGNPLVTLMPGDHLVEVELINHWHTTDFSATFERYAKRYKDSELKNKITSLNLGDYEFQYVSVYESDGQADTTQINVSRRNKPVVLVLNSYESVNWKINNPHNTTIAAVLHGSYKGGSTAYGDLTDTTPVLMKARHFADTWGARTCECRGGRFVCKSMGASTLKDKIQSYGNGRLGGITAEYSASYLDVPAQILDAAFERKNQIKEAGLAKDKALCHGTTGFEEMFSELE